MLKDGMEELIESYPTSFSTFVKNEPNQLATKEKGIDYKKFSEGIFSDGFSFLKKYGTPYVSLKNLVVNKKSINTINDDQKDFVFNLMKGYNISSFFEKSETKDLDNRNLYEKSKYKALDIILECEKSTEKIKKDKKKTLMKIKEVFYQMQ